MDFHILIVISCVFLASLCSLLFINKFFRRKTFEEIIAEKKALNEKIYQSKVAATGPKKPKKLQQQLKKEQKREKKQRQKEQQRDTTEQEDSDAQSEHLSVEDEPKGLSKTHVEFEPDPEVMTFPVALPVAATTVTNSVVTAEKENVGGNQKQKAKKEKKNAKAAAGILINKHEPVAVKETPVVEETLNQFEYKQPKDVVEMKKEKKDEPKQQREQNKKDKGVKKEKHLSEKLVVATENQPAIVESVVVSHVAKELKQQEEKVRHGSPKNQQHTAKAKQQSKKQQKETVAAKELVLALDKLSENDTIGVSLLMNLFHRAELNRSEIQILIDYLLNKQQDMPASHSDWSDDICQKLKRQLEEKERALTEEQEASIGIQAKLRELRTEINTERAHLNNTVKALYEKIQSKEQELVGLNQEFTSLNEKISLERQQFQSKLQLAKQAGSQDLLAQLQMTQNELAHKDKCIAELTCLVNATQQSNEIIQNQAQQIHALEQQREELEKESNNRIFELERAKTVETELAESKVEIRNLQNALESSKVDLSQAHKDFDAIKSELTLVRTVELSEKQNDLQALQAKNDELSQQIAGISGKAEAQSKEQSGLQVTLDTIKKQLADKEQQLVEFNTKNAELLQQLSNAQQNTAQQHDLQQLIDGLKTDLAAKHNEVQLAQEQLGSRERDLLQQLQEQKEKNNELRMKNWKLVEALQNAETTFTKHNEKYNSNANANLVQQQQLFAATQKTSNATVTNSGKDEKQLREIFKRLCPEAVNVCAGTALSLPFDQWMEQVLTTHIKQSLSKTNAANSNSNATSSSNKSTQLNSNSLAHAESNSNHTNNNNNNNNNNSAHNSHNDDELLLNSDATTVNSNSRISNNNNSSSSSDDPVDVQKLNTQNAQLRAKIDELTKLVTKTSNTLSELETRAREQDEHWRSVVHSKDEQIRSLQHSNGKQDI